MLIASQQQIKIFVEYFTKGVERANAKVRAMNQEVFRAQSRQDMMTSAQRKGNEQIRKYREQFQSFGQVMRMDSQILGNFNRSGYRFNTVMGRTANRIRMATHGMRGFRMEMLGVMFFGMAMMRTFTGLFKTSLDWLGVTTIWSTTMGILFLPIAEKILDWALWFLEYIGNMSEGTKLFIGKVVLMGAALGAFLFLFGTFALGIGSLIMAFGWLFSIKGLLISIGAIAGIYGLWKWFDKLGFSAEGAQKQLMLFGVSGELIEKVFSGLKTGTSKLTTILTDSFGGAIDAVSSNTSFWEEKGGKIMNSLILGATDWIKSNPLVLVGAIVGGFLAGPMGIGIGAAIGGALGSIDYSKIQETVNTGFEILTGIVNGFLDNLPIVIEMVTDLIDKIVNFLSDNIGPLLDAGLDILLAILNGISNNMDKITDIVLKIINTIQNWINDNQEIIIDLGLQLGELIGIGLWRALKQSVEMSFAKAFDYMVPGGSTVRSGLGKGLDYLGFQHGGIVPGSPVPILAHAGERITPANRVEAGGGGVQNVTINATISNDYDVRRLADQLKRYWVTDFERVSQGRSI